VYIIIYECVRSRSINIYNCWCSLTYHRPYTVALRLRIYIYLYVWYNNIVICTCKYRRVCGVIDLVRGVFVRRWWGPRTVVAWRGRRVSRVESYTYNAVLPIWLLLHPIGVRETVNSRCDHYFTLSEEEVL